MAIARSRNATSSSAVRQIADLSGANASLSGSSTKTRQPSELDRLEGAQHLRPVLVAPDRRRVGGRLAARASAARTCGSEAKFVCRRTRSMSGCVTSSPRESTAYAYPAVPIARSLDDLADEARGRSRRRRRRVRERARRRRSSCAAGSRAGSRRGPRYRSLRPRADELAALGEVDPAVDAVELERRDANLLLPGRVQVAQLADELLALEEAVEVLLPLCQSRSSRVRRSAGRPPRARAGSPASSCSIDGGGGGRLVPLDAASAPACCPGTRSRAP